MKEKVKTLDDVVMDYAVGLLPRFPKFYWHQKSFTNDEQKSIIENTTQVNAMSVMRRAIAGAKYRETLIVNREHVWEQTGLDWLEKQGYLNNYNGIYLPTTSGINWFNQLIEVKSKEVTK